MNQHLKYWGTIALSILSRFLIRMGILKKYVLVRIDGGICSQMQFYLVGAYLKEKGLPVKYSTEFYRKGGWDNNHKFVRNFDLLEAFPRIEFNAPSRVENILYKAFKLGKNEYWEKFPPPVFLNDYYSLPKERYRKMVLEYFHIDYSLLDCTSSTLLSKIKEQENSVAVHVRRGDLTEYVWPYGYPASDSYFQKSVDIITSSVQNPFFFFFSDEPNYIRNELIQKLSIKNFLIVNCNGSDKGWMDLFLIAACKHQITSKGTMGNVGAAFNPNPTKIITAVDHERARRFWYAENRVIFIPDINEEPGPIKIN